MKKHELQEINAGSMADIAFLLLIFFLVTTTMDTDFGLIRKLPPDIVNTTPPDVNERNVLEILVNRNDDLLVEGDVLSIADLREVTKEFIANPFNNKQLPVVENRKFKYFGNIKLTPGHVISLQSDRGTSYAAYIAVQNELAAAYQDLKDDLARKKYKSSYDELNPEIKAVLDQIYSAKISEAEPVNIAALKKDK